MHRSIYSSFVFLCSIVLSLNGCAQTHKNDADDKNRQVNLDSYWDGVAEIAVYDLQQNRYNDVHKGQIVSVWVKEDFLTKKQVKNDNYINKESTPILKNIQVRKFTTGVYDYSMLSSVFTPLDRRKYPHSLKVSGSSQEWCGHGYIQLNADGKTYDVTEHSYFENIADRKFNTRKEAYLEDEIFNLIRMDPSQLPQGSVQVIPSVNYVQLRHVEAKPFQANTTLETYSGEEFSDSKADLKQYSIEFPELKRTIEIVFEGQAEFKVMGWKDSYPSAFDGKMRSTIVKLSKIKNLKYWNLNSLNDVNLRKDLGLLY